MRNMWNGVSVHEALLPAPDHGFALADSAGDGGGARPPSALRTMIRARQTCFCALLRLRMIVSSQTRSSAVTVMEIPLRITDSRTTANLQKLLFGLFCQVLSTSGEDAPVSLSVFDIGEMYGNFYFARYGLPFVKARS